MADRRWQPAWRGVVLAHVRRIGADALGEWRDKNYQVELKGRIDPVTAVDKAVEAELKKALLAVAPEAGFVGEESWDGTTESEGWIVDPIDGTVNFAAGLPQFALSVAWMERGEALFGCVFAPALGELFWAEKGEGAFFNGTAMQVSPVCDLLHAVGASGFPYWINDKPREQNNLKAWETVLHQVRALRRGGCASLDLAYTAAGRFAFFWEPGLKIWDVAAGQLLVEEAGGIVSRYDGSAFSDRFRPILASTPELHKPLVNILSPFDDGTI